MEASNSKTMLRSNGFEKIWFLLAFRFLNNYSFNLLLLILLSHGHWPKDDIKVTTINNGTETTNNAFKRLCGHHQMFSSRLQMNSCKTQVMGLRWCSSSRRAPQVFF